MNGGAAFLYYIGFTEREKEINLIGFTKTTKQCIIKASREENAMEGLLW